MESESVERKQKKGFQKLKSGISGALKRRRRKRNANKTKRESGSSVDGDSSAASYDSFSVDSKAGNVISPQQEWIHGGSTELTNSAGGRGRTLTKIAELPEEDDGSGEHAPSSHRKGSASKRRYKNSGDSVSSSHSRRSIGSYFGKKERAQPDPLSLVVLLVEPSSLRFELLSLDFDLTSKRSRRSRRRGEYPELHLKVQDVLDQITPEALTDESLKNKAAKPGACLGLIDRTGQVHFGGASLETACAKRPLRSFDTALLQQKNSQTNKVLLSVPTYGGEPHKDVLLGFFGSLHPDDDLDERKLSAETREGVSNALELARPIFADPNVIGLMEGSGYALDGWKKETPKAQPKLGKPLPPPVREPPKPKSSMVKLLLGVLVVLLATLLAWSLVAGGLHYLPSIEAGDVGVVAEENDGPMTLEGHLVYAYEYAKEWYMARGAVSATE